MKSLGKFAKSAEDTFLRVKICNEGLNLHVRPRQFSKPVAPVAQAKRSILEVGAAALGS